MDGARGPDATTWGDDGCPWVGLYAGCDDLCDGVRECPFEGAVCRTDWDLCVPPDLHRTFEGCNHPFTGTPEPGPAKQCPRADFACLDDLRSGPNIDERGQALGAGCVHISYCLADPAFRPNHDCYYSDLTRVRTGPPTEACPADVSTVFTFCGPECGSCPPVEDSPGNWYYGCVGVNDERGTGICAFQDACGPGSALLEEETSELLFGPGHPPACLVQRDPVSGEYWDWGWTVSVEACAAYRERYPDAFDCRDFDWETIP